MIASLVLDLGVSGQVEFHVKTGTAGGIGEDVVSSCDGEGLDVGKGHGCLFRGDVVLWCSSIEVDQIKRGVEFGLDTGLVSKRLLLITVLGDEVLESVFLPANKVLLGLAVAVISLTSRKKLPSPELVKLVNHYIDDLIVVLVVTVAETKGIVVEIGHGLTRCSHEPIPERSGVVTWVTLAIGREQDKCNRSGRDLLDLVWAGISKIDHK